MHSMDNVKVKQRKHIIILPINNRKRNHWKTSRPPLSVTKMPAINQHIKTNRRILFTARQFTSEPSKIIFQRPTRNHFSQQSRHTYNQPTNQPVICHTLKTVRCVVPNTNKNHGQINVRHRMVMDLEEKFFNIADRRRRKKSRGTDIEMIFAVSIYSDCLTVRQQLEKRWLQAETSSMLRWQSQNLTKNLREASGI